VTYILICFGNIFEHLCILEFSSGEQDFITVTSEKFSFSKCSALTVDGSGYPTEVCGTQLICGKAFDQRLVLI
jgi:hypothetical protein